MTPETRAALALVQAGVPAAQVDRVLRMIDVDAADTADTIAEKVPGLATDLPGLFTPAAPAGAPGAGGGVRAGAERYAGKTMGELGQEALRVAGIRPKTADLPTSMDQARERYAKRKGTPSWTPGGDVA